VLIQVKFLIVSAAVTLLTACGTTVLTENDAPGPMQDEALVVIGVRSPGYRIMLFPGEVVQGKFRQNILSGAVLSGVAKDGYVVARLKSGQTVGLSRIAAPKGDRILYEFFNPCGEQKTLVFEVPKAQVVYLADVTDKKESTHLAVQYQAFLPAAQAYMRDNFRRVLQEVKQQEIQFLPTTQGCNSTPIVIPIYLGKP
jgi:hypothetical protein